jgi:Na+-transporting methylmalonyl-CoA/oxaloacetate decarboxylase gamma subunit
MSANDLGSSCVLFFLSFLFFLLWQMHNKVHRVLEEAFVWGDAEMQHKVHKVLEEAFFWRVFFHFVA